jgi:hypothetical protein
MTERKLPIEVGIAVGDALDRMSRLFELGFEQDEFGQLIARNCTVILYPVGDEYEIDIPLPNGSAVGCDVPGEALKGRTAQEIQDGQRHAAA